MEEEVKRAEIEPIIRFLDVSKIYKYSGIRTAAGGDGADGGDEEGEDDDLLPVDEDEKQVLRPGETRAALQNISMSILPGERVGILGVNGSGKSTLLNIVSGISYPTSGRVIGRGSLVPLSQVARPLNQKWSGLRNLRALARLLGFRAELIDERSDEIACFAEMKDAISQPIATYSRNMYARLAFAAALELDADIYVADDTLGVGDHAYQAKCFQRLVKLCNSGKTLLFATHKLKLIEQLCTRAIWLDKGRIRADSGPAAIIANYLARSEKSEAEEDEDEGDEVSAIRSWFRQRYGHDYPLREPEIQETWRVREPEDQEFGRPIKRRKQSWQSREAWARPNAGVCRYCRGQCYLLCSRCHKCR